MSARLRALCAMALLVAACGGPAYSPLPESVGPTPVLPVPRVDTLPTVNIALATGWPAGAAPTAAEGLKVMPFATGLDHPRWLHVLPNGDVLVAESNRQPSPPKGLRGFIEKQIMGIAGAEVPSADRISLLRDADGDGKAEMRSILLAELTSPFGMALLDGDLYVADTDALLRFPYTPGATRIDAPGERIVALPANSPNRHWTKGMVAGADGRLYISVGSNSDHGENGMAAETFRAAIWIVDPASRTAALFAAGLRNPVGLDFEPRTGVLWTVVNERDELGNDLVPDYLTSVRRGGFYGWPHFYYGDRRDPRVPQPPSEPAVRVIAADYALGSHVAPLGLAFAKDDRLGPAFSQGAFIGQHGSWNRRPATGYSVVYVPFRKGRPSGKPVEVLTGFRTEQGTAQGRPAGVAMGLDGALLVADDVGNTIWRVAGAD